MSDQHYNPLLYQTLANGNPLYSPTQPSPGSLGGGASNGLYPLYQQHGVTSYNNGAIPVYSRQISQKFQQQPLTHPHLQQQHHHQPQLRQPSGLSSPATIPASLTPQLGADSGPYQQQIHAANLSRQSATPHFRARAAAAVARSTGMNSAVSIMSPNGGTSSKTGSTTTIGEGADKNGTSSPNAPKWTTLDMGGMGLKNISGSLFRYEFLTALYINHNNLHYLSPEVRHLRNLTVLDASGNKLTLIPPELGMLVNLKELLLVDNGLVTLPAELGTLFQLEILALEGNPLNESLKTLLQQEGTTAVIVYLRENCTVPLPPPEREWITIEDDSGTLAGQDTFTTFSYNILAESYATPQMYGYTPSWALTWDYRKELILQEILAYSADIVCLQEVEMGQFEDYFKEQMKHQADYEGVFYPKTRAKTMPEKERRLVDGCAIFFKASKFSLIDKHLVEFNHLALQRPDFRKTEDIFNRVMTKDNISVIALLEHKETKNRLVVSNSHLCWDPLFRDVKLVQVAMLLDELDKLSTQWAHLPVSSTPSKGDSASGNNSSSSSSTSGKLPTLILGDFNSERNSGVYEFLVKGVAAQDHEDFMSYAYGHYTTEGLAHKLSLRSAYSHEKELPFSNFTPSYVELIDYIFYTSNSLSILGLLGGVEKEYMSRVVGFPNAHFPSDHIPILAEFKFQAQKTLPKHAPNFGSTSSLHGSNNHPRN
ncbi:CCR4-NOT transcription complex subunit 6 [Entomortierella parvispora]|uniref:CCR4-Not complex 3'-5'-exoribonuclease subunit Ccr4 n=1 Tax=Entomortierella parvispora TaxID=205924 RepID=A0A9P3H2N8_9FUNG|nr:CCR4-NOT transcription complex subunit 6 [Entomortierella parvispora]